MSSRLFHYPKVFKRVGAGNVAETWVVGILPLSSSFFEFFLNCFHHDARSRFDGGEAAACAACGTSCGADNAAFPVAMMRVT